MMAKTADARTNIRVRLDELERLIVEACEATGTTPEKAAKELELALQENRGHTGGICPVSVEDLLNAPHLLFGEAQGKFAENLVQQRLAGFLWVTLKTLKALDSLTPHFDLGWTIGQMAAALEYPALRSQIVHDLRSMQGKRASRKRHSQPGGSRDKQRQIREIWASGKYSSRDRCAEEECAALGISFSAARKALRNTPNP